jgi:hypothetical protein
MSDFNNRGLLFKNFRKRQPKHPDVTGEATIDGRKFKIAGWIKQGRRGEFHSLAFTEDQTEAPPAEAPKNNVPAQSEHDIAF